jgi:hypothetical protein
MGASAWAYYHRNDLLRLRWTTLGLAIAFVEFGAMTVLDVLGGFPTLEESLKIVAEATIVTAILAAHRDSAPGPDPSANVTRPRSHRSRPQPCARCESFYGSEQRLRQRHAY